MKHLQRNLIAHCQSGSSDKVYIVSVRHVPNNNAYIIVAKWGRRIGNNNFQSQIKGTFQTLGGALASMESFFREKIKKGYKDIESPNYLGGVTIASVQQHLEAESGGPVINPVEPLQDDSVKKTMERAEKKKAAKLLQNRSGVLPHQIIQVVCINNLGIEDRFDIDVEYNARECVAKPEMLFVTDMHGKEDQYFVERFQRTEDSP